MTPDQCRQARKLLGLSQDRLATLAQVSQTSVGFCERGIKQRHQTIAAIRTALEAAGAEFTNGDAPGVHLRSPSQA